jgi:hypothetical protein
MSSPSGTEGVDRCAQVPILHSSMTRISDLSVAPFQVGRQPRELWASGDYVVVEVLRAPPSFRLELPTGRMVELTAGELVVGALGRRHATLEATGSWELVGDDGWMELLTGGGLLGRSSSRSALIAPLPRVRYRGHVERDGLPMRMAGFAARHHDPEAPDHHHRLPPIVMIIGTSMSAGKTATARALIRRLRCMGLGVMGAKVTGAGRYRDILTMADVGADPVFDFVDAGLPSTVCPEPEYAEALDLLIARMAEAVAHRRGHTTVGDRARRPQQLMTSIDAECPIDAAVIEVGASPLEPYNGSAAVERLRDSTCLTVLCASDPYAVVGIMQAFDVRPDLVTGIASNTIAGVELVERLTGVRTLDVRNPATTPELDGLLRSALGLHGFG